MSKQKIFIACDTQNIKTTRKIINNSQNNKIEIGYKIGLEFFLTPKGRNFIANLKKKKSSLI